MTAYLIVLAIWGWSLAGYMILSIHSTCTWSNTTSSWREAHIVVRRSLFSDEMKVGLTLSILLSPLALFVTMLLYIVDAIAHRNEQKRLAQEQRDEDERIIRDAKKQYELGYMAGARASNAWSDAWEGTES